MAASDVFEGSPQFGTATELPPSPPAGEEEELGAMTLVEHLEELRKRILFSLASVAVLSIVGFIFWNPIIGFLTSPLPDIANGLRHSPSQKLIATAIGEPFMVALEISVVVGILLSTPMILYQTWAFLAPALTRKERKYALPFTLLGCVLCVLGVAVGFIVLRFPVDWLINFGSNRFTLLPDANSYFSFVAYFLLAFAVVFELPLVLTFMGVVGIVNSTVLRQKRMYILFGLWFLSCFITPGADPYSPVIIAVSFTILFELTVILLRAIGK